MNRQLIQDLIETERGTSFHGLSTQFFKELDAKVNLEKDPSARQKLKTKIEYVSRSVEDACALGGAVGIVGPLGECPSDLSFYNPDLFHADHLLC